MASWALLLALSGFEYDGTEYHLSFAPRIDRDQFYTFWSCDSGWGSFALEGKKVTLSVDFGYLNIERFSLPSDYGFIGIEEATRNGETLRVNFTPIDIRFEGRLTLREDENLIFHFTTE